MTRTPLILGELLAECDAHGVRLLLADDDGLTIDAPQGVLTPDLVDRLKARKADVLAMLRPTLAAAPALPVATGDAPTTPVCPCGSTTWRDVPIHGGQSVRRDCGRCGRFLDFPVWYGNTTSQKEM